jgi:hypothetical protein
MNEKMYLFNPFEIQKKSNNELRNIYYEVFTNLIEEPNTMYEYSHNIEVYSNLIYIIGEIIARLTKDVIELKTDIQIESAIKCVEERKLWNVERDGKQPAMAYFEALGIRYCEDKIKLQAEKECSIRRFRNAYESTNEKINALKKKMDAIKFENIGE